MSTRQALRELHIRLAQRLQEARTQPHTTMQWLAVQVASRPYLLALQQAGEIFVWQEPLPLPYTQPWFWGVVNLRGTLTGVVDVVGLQGHIRRHPHKGMEPPHLVALHDELEVNAALVVDRLLGLRSAQELQSTDVENAQPWVQTYIDAEGQTWQALDLQRLSQAAPFLCVSA